MTLLVANIIGETTIEQQSEYTLVMNENTSDSQYELDVREIDGEPFSDIMSALDAVSEDGTLVLINNFEPEPLYSVLEQRGFAYETTRVAPDEWRVMINRT